MKEAITGYVTALINTYNNKLEKISSDNFQARNLNGIFIKDLDSLLDFVDDISEEERMHTIETFKENKQLRKRVRELEESCENMCEVERTLHGQIKELKEKSEKVQIKVFLMEGNK